MGRNAKRKAERRSRTVLLSGEQAEVFDEQMDSDRDWFEGSDQCVRFRPEIPGEFNDQLMLGHQPMSLQARDFHTKRDVPLPGGWVCVVDVLRAVEGGDPSGMRARLRCLAPTTGELRQAMEQQAIQYAHWALAALKAQGAKRSP